jgi:hypothetical protein
MNSSLAINCKPFLIRTVKHFASFVNIPAWPLGNTDLEGFAPEVNPIPIKSILL